MRIRSLRPARAFVLGASIALSGPIWAQEAASAPPQPDRSLAAPRDSYENARAVWLAECRSRLSLVYGSRFGAGEYCDSYLDYYSPAQPVTAPRPVPDRPGTDCKEEVVYEYVDVPVPARRIIPRRSSPVRRAHPAPDKRVPF